MTKGMARLATLVALVAMHTAITARADVRELVEAGKITWTGTPAVIYLNADGTTADASAYDHLVLKFTKTGDAGALTLADGIKGQARVLVVGGGGAGGTSTSTTGGAGGGGGAGGFIDTECTIEGEATYQVTVGDGGAAALSMDTKVGEDGEISSFGEIVAQGGGGGGAQSDGNTGGSGGGGSAYYDTSKVNKVGGGSIASGDEKGNAGGAGNVAGYGGGGGGASAVGQDSSSSKSKGGAGLESDITGEALFYAGGGGGGRTKLQNALAGGNGGGGKGGSTTLAASAGADGLGGGGGGSGTTDPGGKGGSGVVIVRITEAREITLKDPSIDDIMYTGNNIVPFDFGIAYIYISGVTNATAAGTYTFDVKPNEDGGFSWKSGGADAKTVTWKITKRVIAQPTVAEDLVYNGEVQAGVVLSDEVLQFCDYAEGGETNAVNAGEHTFTLSLKDKVNTTWITSTSTLTTDDFFGFSIDRWPRKLPQRSRPRHC